MDEDIGDLRTQVGMLKANIRDLEDDKRDLEEVQSQLLERIQELECMLPVSIAYQVMYIV